MNNVLIISMNSMSLHANNGKTLTNIFSKYHQNEVSQIYFQDEIPESNKFNSFYRIRDVDIIHSFFNKINVGGEVKPQDFVFSHFDQYGKIKLIIRNFIKKSFILKKIFREFLYLKYDKYESDMNRWIEESKPDSIFLVASEYNFPALLVLRISKKYNLPINVFFMDDHIFMKKSIIRKIVDYSQAKIYNDIVEGSENRYCIGEEMARFYESKYHKKFDWIMNSVDSEDFSFNKNYSNLSEDINIAYAGGLTIGRFDALLKFNDIMHNYSKIRKIRINLCVCSGTELSSNKIKILKSKGINFLGKVDNQELHNIYNSIDFVLHLESDRKEYKNMTRYSISTKIPECLASKICLIAYGPEDIASMKLIYQNNLGLYLNSNSKRHYLFERLDEIFSDSNKCNFLVENGFKFYFKNFSKEVFSSKILKALNNDRVKQ